jgi:endonuclease-3
MDAARRVETVQAVLDEHVGDPEVPLHHRDAFTLLVAVVLSAQCTDARVNMVTPALFRAAPDPARLAALGEAQILSYIRTCGLAPTKARNLAALGRVLCERHGGAVPPDADALQALPGVGRKTASVVRVTAFGIPAMPVDTHIFRCARRWGLSQGKDVRQVERDLCAVLPPSAWGRFHLQVIHFGRRWCTARAHRDDACPMCARLGDNAGSGG